VNLNHSGLQLVASACGGDYNVRQRQIVRRRQAQPAFLNESADDGRGAEPAIVRVGEDEPALGKAPAA
jgi:hypothetical protein